MSLTVLKQSAPTGVQVIGGIYAPSQIAGNGTTATVTQNGHGYGSGDTVVIGGSSASAFAGTYTITVVNSNSYTFASTVNSTVTGTITAQKINDPNLGTIVCGGQPANAGYGGFFVEPVGPKTSGDTTANGYGWSFDLRCQSPSVNPTVYHTMTVSSGSTSVYVFDQWFYVNSYASGYYGKQNNMIGMNTSNGHFWNYAGGGDTGIAVPIRQWFQLRVCTQQAANGTNANVPTLAMFRLVGSGYSTSSWTVLFSGNTSAGFAAGSVGSWSGGNLQGDPFYGRYGMPTLMTSNAASWSAFTASGGDAYVAVPNQVEPPSYNATTGSCAVAYYWDPANTTGLASDSNDGVTATTPMLSLSRVNGKAGNGGFLAPPTPVQTAVNGVASGTTYTAVSATALRQAYLDKTAAWTGDVLNILHKGAEFVLAGTLNISVDGMTINGFYGSPSGTTLQWNATNFQAVTPSAWSLVSGKTCTYLATGAAAGSVLFQNRILLQSQTSIANVESNAGSYYNDGSGNLYVHPLFSTNPGSDGNRYELTTMSSSGNGALIVNFNGAYNLCKGIYGSGCVAAGAGAAYVFGLSNTVAEQNCYSVFDTCTADFYGNHGFGNVAGSMTGNFVAYVNCVAQRGMPGNWAFVDYTAAGSGNQSDYYQCTTGIGTCLVPGLARPTYQGAAWGTHGATNGVTSATFTDCDFSTSAGVNSQISCNVTVNGGAIGWGGASLDGSASGTAVFNGVNCTNALLNGGDSGAVFNNCIFSNLVYSYNTSGSKLTFNYCTIDYSACGNGAAMNLNSSGNNAIVFNKCLLIPGGNVMTNNAAAGDSVTTHSCEIQQSSGAVLHANYHTVGNNLTLAGAQTAGVDAGSVTVTAASVDSYTYVRSAQSSITAVTALSQDFTGTLFASRQTIGAYEFVSSAGLVTAGFGANVVDDPDGYFVR